MRRREDEEARPKRRIRRSPRSVRPAVVRGADRPVVVAHRGAWQTAPENTWAAIDAALHSRADGVEIDVRIAADDIPVLAHDRDLRRTHGERILVCAHPAALLPVPTLESVLAMLAERHAGTLLDVELKEHLAPDRLAALMDRAGWRGPTLITSFDPHTVRSYSRAGWTTGLLEEYRYLKKEEAVTLLASTEADLLCVRNPILMGRLRTAAHEAGAALWAWTLNRRNDLRRAHRHQLDGVITDEPGLACELFTKKTRSAEREARLPNESESRDAT